MVLAVVGDVEIFPAVVVVVADTDALSPTARGQARFRGDIGERAVMIVAVEMVRRPLTGFRRFQGCAVHDEDIEPAIIVVVEDGDARACGLNNVLLAVGPAEDFRYRQPGLLGDINEVGDWLRWRSRLLGGLLREQGVGHRQDEDKNRCSGNELPERTRTRNRKHADFGYYQNRRWVISCVATESLQSPKRKHMTCGKDFIRARMDVLVGTHLSTAEVLGECTRTLSSPVRRAAKQVGQFWKNRVPSRHFVGVQSDCNERDVLAQLQ